jgi:hypothetical protein
MTTYVQNWIHIWKPFILSSVKSATNLSIWGVHCLSTYFIPTRAVPHQPLAACAHRTARSRIRDLPALPQPAFRFCSLRSFFAPQPRPSSLTNWSQLWHPRHPLERLVHHSRMVSLLPAALPHMNSLAPAHIFTS